MQTLIASIAGIDNSLFIIHNARDLEIVLLARLTKRSNTLRMSFTDKDRSINTQNNATRIWCRKEPLFPGGFLYEIGRFYLLDDVVLSTRLIKSIFVISRFLSY